MRNRERIKIKMNAQTEFKAMFGSDERDQIYEKRIPDIPPDKLMPCLKKIISNINAYSFGPAQWASYKLSIVQEYKYVAQNFLIWSLNASPTKINLKWDKLVSAKDIFLCYIALQDMLPSNVRIPNFWRLIDKELGLENESGLSSSEEDEKEEGGKGE